MKTINIARPFVVLAVITILFGGPVAHQTHALRVPLEVTAQPVRAVEPDPPVNGKIAFTHFDFPNGEKIATVNDDGTNLTLLTAPIENSEGPAFSPDGTQIAFSKVTSIWIMNADGSQQRFLPNTLSNSNSNNPTWSPDGTKIAFSLDYKIWVVNVDGTNAIQLSDGTTLDDFAAWSPDGSKIAFVKDYFSPNAQIYVMSSDGSNPVNLTNSIFACRHPAWSPDGSKIAYDSSAEIFTMNPDGSNQTQISTTPYVFFNEDPAWSPDGSKIAFTSYRDGNAQIYVMNADGTNEARVTNSLAEDNRPSWGPVPTPAPIPAAANLVASGGLDLLAANGATVTHNVGATNYGPDTASNVKYTIQLPPNATYGTATNPYGSCTADAPNAQGTLVTCTVGNIPVFESRFISHTAIVTGAPYEVLTFSSTVSSDTADPYPDSNVFSVAVQIEGPPVPTPTPATGANPLIAFETRRDGNSEIYSRRADGSAQVNLTNDPADDADFAWSPDGSKLAFSRLVDVNNNNRELFVMNADGSNPLRLTNSPDDQDSGAVWSPDGTKLLFTSQSNLTNTRALWVTNADGSNQIKIGIAAYDYDNDPTWSPDGTKIAYAREYYDGMNATERNIYTANADGSNRIRIANAPGESDFSPAWSADGTKINFVRALYGGAVDIYDMNVDGSNQRNLSNMGTVYGYPAPSRSVDRSKIAFIAGAAAANPTVYVMNADGSSRLSVFNTTYYVATLGWSPDTTKLVIGTIFNVGQGAGIHVANADGSGSVHFGGDAEYNQNPDWSPDSTRIVFTTRRTGNDGIDIINANGTGRVALSTDSAYYAHPKWQPTGNTPAGTNVTITVNGVTLTFSNVTQAGQTTVTPIDPNSLSGVPGEYVINANSLAFEIHTTAVYTGPITVGFQVPSVNNPITFSALRVLHGEPPPVPNFVDRTVLAPDTPAPNFATRTIYARVTSLSPFIILERRDTTPPVTTATLSTPPNAAGWHKANVTVTLNATDNAGGSGVQSITYSAAGAQPIAQTTVTGNTVAVSITTEGITTLSYRATDAQGNVETAKTITVKLDKTAPSITITRPTATVYLLNQLVTASFQCTDTGSGGATCTGPVANGAALNTASVGAKNFTVNATDVAGNTSQKSVDYTVTYGINPLFDQTKANKSGSTIPIKLEVVNASGVNCSASNIVVTATAVTRLSNNAPGALEDPGNSNPDFNFNFTGGQYHFNLKTTGYATGTYRLDFQVSGDPVTHSVQFQVK
jgi:Tol biopolymer transport system component